MSIIPRHILTILCEQGDIATAYGVEQKPSMFLVGTDGRIVAVQVFQHMCLHQAHQIMLTHMLMCVLNFRAVW